ncbi:hypothetical protein BW242_22435 [Escherichia coli]|nr:hypothetical protein BW242_22435 [Escherichia coli]
MRRERLIRPTKYCKFKILQKSCRPDKRSASGSVAFVISLNTACGRCCSFCGRRISARPETPFPPLFQFIDYSHKNYWHAFCQ